MIKSLQNIALIMLVVFAVSGCSTDNSSNPMSSEQTGTATLLSTEKVDIPADARFQYATLYLHCTLANGEPINIHRVIEPWEEMAVTWDNFGGAFAPEVINTFLADSIGWRSVDVSSLVIPWRNGSYQNFGLLLDQAEEKFPWAKFLSREAPENQPYIEIAYITDTGYIFEKIYPLGDAYIYESQPGSNFGDSYYLRTGWDYFDALEKQSLLIFDIPLKQDNPDVGCTRTIGYWKNHAGCGPQDDVVTPLLPIWLGNPDEGKSILVDTPKKAVGILKMKTFGHSRNGITKLYAQLLAAKLNIASGANDTDISAVIDKADRFLTNKNWKNWKRLTVKKKKRVLHWMRKLDKYNNGLIGPGHCE